MKISFAKYTLFFLMLVPMVTAFSSKDLEDWLSYKRKFGKKYETEIEDYRRMKIFLLKKRDVEHHNQMYWNVTKTFKKGINKFSDFTQTERLKKKSRLLSVAHQRRYAFMFNPQKGVELPDFLDWRTKGAVTEIKDQGDCGACWAFSATGALEAQHYLNGGNLVSFSEQNLIDCSGQEGNLGCNGGYVELAFEYIKKNNGVETEESYPYNGEVNGCHTNTSSGPALSGYAVLPSGDEWSLQYAVARLGPVSVSIDVQDSFDDYKSGIYYGEDCSPMDHNHAALVVGYGSEEGTDYWLVKNSWGKDWGEDGYIKMTRNRGNNCGIALSPTFPILSMQPING